MWNVILTYGRVLLASTPKYVFTPRGEITHEVVGVNNTHPTMVNPDYNMVITFWSLPTNILLIKTKLKIESKTIVLPCNPVIWWSTLLLPPTPTYGIQEKHSCSFTDIEAYMNDGTIHFTWSCMHTLRFKLVYSWRWSVVVRRAPHDHRPCILKKQ